MSRVSRILQAAGLVTRTPEPEPAYVEAAIEAPVEVAPAIELTGDDSLKLTEGAKASDIYAQAGVVDGPYPVERMIKMLGGLSQMDVASRRVAVEAMDSADDTWTIGDVLADAQAKIDALAGYKSQVDQLRQAIGAEIEQRVSTSQEEKTTALAEIDRQIAELQTRREQTLSDSSTLVAQLRGQGLAAEDAGGREKARLDEAIKQINIVVSLFSASATAGATPSSN